MADFRTDTSAIKVDTPKGMSLSDMLNIQKSSYELSKIKELYPALISGEQAKSKTAEIESEKAGLGLQKEQQLNNERKVIQTFMSNPKNFQNENGEIDIDKVNSVLPAIAPLSGTEHASKLTTLANNHSTATTAKLNMTQQQRGIVASTYGALGYSGENDPKVYMAALSRLKEQFPDDKNIQAYVDSSISSLNLMGAQPNPNIAKTAIQSSQQLLSPEKQQSVFSPTTGLSNVGGLNVQSTTQPAVGGNAPSATYSLPNIGGNQQQPPQSTPQNTPAEKKQPLFIERFPPRPETYPPQISELEKPTFEQGFALKQNSSKLASDAANLKTSLEAARKNIKESSGTAIGQGIRNAKQIFVSNPELEILLKNAADIQARQGQLLGATTDASRETTSKTSPNANLSEKGLASILDRIDADTTNIMQFNKGLGSYIDKKGNTNGHLNALSYKDAWTNNFDADVFKYHNIAKSNMSKEEKAKAKKELLKGKDITDFENKLHSLHRLEQGEN
jgi:hypothetical protein